MRRLLQDVLGGLLFIAGFLTAITSGISWITKYWSHDLVPAAAMLIQLAIGVVVAGLGMYIWARVAKSYCHECRKGFLSGDRVMHAATALPLGGGSYVYHQACVGEDLRTFFRRRPAYKIRKFTYGTKE